MSTLRLANGISTAYSADTNPLFDGETIQVSATCELTEAEIRAFDSAMALLYGGLLADGIYPPVRRAIVYFIGEDSFTLSLPNPLTYGGYTSIIIYPVNRWRAKRFSNNQMVVIMLEELCHCFYDIYDEYIVKEKVTALIQREFPRMTLNSLYVGFSVPDPSA